jgi:hypothetical protein
VAVDVLSGILGRMVRVLIILYVLAERVVCVVPFPEGYGASVHFQFPGKEFITLGTSVVVYLTLMPTDDSH